MSGAASCLFALVAVATLACSSGGDDGSREGQACSRGTTTASCDACAQLACKTKYAASFHDPQPELGDREQAGRCVDRARCIAHCACGDGACYDLCPPSIACSATLFELRNCEAVQCPDECKASLEGVTGSCIELARCCGSPRLPEGFRAVCRNVAADGKVEVCEDRLKNVFRANDYCDSVISAH